MVLQTRLVRGKDLRNSTPEMYTPASCKHVLVKCICCVRRGQQKKRERKCDDVTHVFTHEICYSQWLRARTPDPSAISGLMLFIKQRTPCGRMPVKTAFDPGSW